VASTLRNGKLGFTRHSVYFHQETSTKCAKKIEVANLDKINLTVATVEERFGHREFITHSAGHLVQSLKDHGVRMLPKTNVMQLHSETATFAEYCLQVTWLDLLPKDHNGSVPAALRFEDATVQHLR
jgi:hypothetical protein